VKVLEETGVVTRVIERRTHPLFAAADWMDRHGEGAPISAR
jgi:hypothetical protein